MIYGSSSGRRSPWHYVGMGCIGLLIVGVILSLVGGFLLYNSFRRFDREYRAGIRTPITRSDLVLKFRGIPFYPGAEVQIDDDFQHFRASLLLMKQIANFQNADVALLTASDGPDSILPWYERSLVGAGYLPVAPQADTPANDTVKTVTYQKNQDFVTVEVISLPPGPRRKSRILLYRFENMQPGFNPPTVPVPRHRTPR